LETKRIYEGMFLVDTGLGSNWDRLEETIGRLMTRAEAELLYCKKWDERRLAYQIAGRKRGMYVLTFFKASADRIAGLKRDVGLTEGLIRLLVLRRDKLSEEKVRELAEGPGIIPVRTFPGSGPPVEKAKIRADQIKPRKEPEEERPKEPLETPGLQESPEQEAPAQAPAAEPVQIDAPVTEAEAPVAERPQDPPAEERLEGDRNGEL